MFCGVAMANRKIEYRVNDKPIPAEQGKALAIAVSLSIRERSEQGRIARRIARTDKLPLERRSVARAMLFVEIKLVKALWVLERAISADGARGHSTRNGIEYMHDRLDQYANAIANGGWHVAAPRPALPSSKEIDEAQQVQRWLSWLPPEEARVLTVGAMAKRGDAGRKINWMRVKGRLPEIRDYTDRHLRGIYSSALRNIVAEQAFGSLRD